MNTTFTKKVNDSRTVAVIIGGGAAGLMAGIAMADCDKRVIILEKNPFVGKKLNITGKGRCNLTNLCDINEFLENVPTNPRFLYKALNILPPAGLMQMFESFSVPLKVERGRRVFPVSDHARDITDALRTECLRGGISIYHGTAKRIITDKNIVTGVEYSHNGTSEIIDCSNVLIATGGAGYPLTGSTGDGYLLAKMLGHTVVQPEGALVPLVTAEKWACDCMGLSLKNVILSIYNADGKCIYTEMGELLFTHFGISGPLVLSASSHFKDTPVYAKIDLKPAMDEDELDRRVLRAFDESKNKDFSNAIGAVLPQKLIESVVSISEIDGGTKVNNITKQQRHTLVSLLKALPLTIIKKRPLSEAIITSGGVNVKEINPSTMQSKLVGGLYFAGEVIDVDAYTGGYNLQIAFSTGYLAGLSMRGIN